jgi:hypothetical protein
MDQLIRELESLPSADAAPLQLAYRVIRAAFGEQTDAVAWIVDHGNPLTSLDAALTLVPTDWAWWEVGKYMSETSPLRAFGDGMPYRAKIGKTWGDTTAWGSGMSGPLALCIAALKARHV